MFTDIRPDSEIIKDDTIILVADKEGLYNNPVSLRDEIDWDDTNSLLKEAGTSINSILEKQVSKQLNDV